MVVVVTGGYLEEVPCELDFLQEVVNVAPMPGFIKLHHSHVQRSHARNTWNRRFCHKMPPIEKYFYGRKIFDLKMENTTNKVILCILIPCEIGVS